MQTKSFSKSLLFASLFISFIVIAVLFVFHTTNAAVNLPWSTTYNCADWTQGQTLNCDGLGTHGGWTTSNGSREQITAAANYQGGSGGRGQRHWLGDGVNNISGGLSVSFASPQSEIWIRWYMRYEQGFQWNPYLMNQKILYFDPTSFPRLIVEYYGQDRVQIYSYATSQGYPSVGNGWNTVMANGGTDARGNKTSDGQWHLWEFHVKMDTNGSNGILELWIDQKKVIDATNANLGATVLQYLAIGENGFTPGNGRDMYVDYDDIVISTTGPIGPVTGGGDAQAPSVPAGFSAQAISSSQINLSWTASTDNVGVAGYRIYRCTGSGCIPSTQIATSTTNSYSNIGLIASTVYVYRVAAYDAAGNVSGQSSSVTATTQVIADITPPASPTGLTVQ